MANFSTKVRFNFVDAKGFYAHMQFFYSLDSWANGSALTTSLDTALAALTNADINEGMGVGFTPQFPGVLGTQADFGSVEDKAVLTYVDNFGTIHRYKLPAPKASIFFADGMTVNPANAGVVALNQVILNAAANAFFVSSRDQVALIEFVGGLRTRVRNQRRINIFTRNPAETGPAE